MGAAWIAASALHLLSRDRLIGWDAEQRRARLHRVARLSRYLIRPGVACRNLASQVLRQLLRQLRSDFEERYGLSRNLVEIFVDGTTHSGASLRAANWRLLGETAGRGRQNRSHEAAAGGKQAYVYELLPDWRHRMGVGPAPALATDPLAAGEGLDGPGWAAAEFDGAPLGDARPSARLVEIAAALGEDPMASFPAAAKGSRAQVKAHYRFLNLPDGAKLSPEPIL